MKKYVKIVSDDARFARMLALELADIGVEVTAEFNSEDNTARYVVADLDCCSVEELQAMKEYSVIIGFSRLYEDNLTEKTPYCYVVLHRPFPIASLAEAFGAEMVTPHAKRQSKPISNHKKADYLTVDPIEKAAIWGDIHISLSDNEFKVLSILCENRGAIVEREKIYTLLGAEDGNMGDVYICHLRRKIDNKLGLKLIYTIRGKGYMLKN